MVGGVNVLTSRSCSESVSMMVRYDHPLLSLFASGRDNLSFFLSTVALGTQGVVGGGAVGGARCAGRGARWGTQGVVGGGATRCGHLANNTIILSSGRVRDGRVQSASFFLLSFFLSKSGSWIQRLEG